MALQAARTGNEAKAAVRDRHARTDGDAENAGLQGWKTHTTILRGPYLNVAFPHL